MTTDVKLFHQSSCRLVHQYRIYQDPMPHVSLRGTVLRKLCAFVNQAMTVAWLTSLHLSIPSSGTTPRGDQVMASTPISPPRREVPGTACSESNESGVFGLWTGYFHDCTSDLCALPFCRPILRQGYYFAATISSLAGPAGICSYWKPGSSEVLPWDISSIRLPSLSQSEPLPTGWAQLVVPDTSVVDDMFSSSISLMALDSAEDMVRDGGPIPMTPVDPIDDSLHLEPLLDWSFHRSMLHNSVQSDGTFFSATASPTGQAPGLRRSPIMGRRIGREGPFVATNPHPRIGDNLSGCAYQCTTYRDSDFVWVATTPPAVLGVGGGYGIRSLVGARSARLDPVLIACSVHRCSTPALPGRMPHDLQLEYYGSVCSEPPWDGDEAS